MSTPTLEELQREETADNLLSALLGVAADVGLRVSSWATGAVTRTILAIVANNLESLSAVQVILVNSGFLDFATSTWLTALADQVYDVQRTPAEAAAGTLTLTNSTDADITIDANGLHAANSTSGKTYTSTNASPVVVPANGENTIDVLADELGTASDSSPGEIDTIVNTILGLTCTNDDPVLGSDEMSDADLRALCRSSLGAVSPNGPAEAYDYVAKTTEGLTLSINRTRVVPDPDTGEVLLYLANRNGAPSGGDVSAVETNILSLATPLAVTPVVAAASELSDNSVEYTAYVEDSPLSDAEIKAAIAASLEAMVSNLPIGGYTIGAMGAREIDVGMFETAIFNALPEIKGVSLTTPSANIAMAIDDVVTLGTITGTITRL